MPRKKYSDEDIVEHAKHTRSLGALLKALGLRVAGGNYINMKRKLQLLHVDTSHWTGQAWSKNEQQKDFKDYKRPKHFKRWLVQKRGHRCEKCLLTEWLGQNLTLELDHIDGDRTNNSETNLMLLCPNCHSQTTTWRGRKNKKT
jgi:5-methylcytosine-specific restriction endonuclease McrA